MKYEILMFDTDGTLFNFKESERDALNNIKYTDKSKVLIVNIPTPSTNQTADMLLLLS